MYIDRCDIYIYFCDKFGCYCGYLAFIISYLRWICIQYNVIHTLFYNLKQMKIPLFYLWHSLELIFHVFG